MLTTVVQTVQKEKVPIGVMMEGSHTLLAVLRHLG
jgi:hypothetical protein